MSSLISVSLTAQPIHRSEVPGNEDLILLGSSVYLHDMTPRMARKWIEVLETIAKEA